MLSSRFTSQRLAGITAVALLAPAYFAGDAFAQSWASSSTVPHDPGVRGGPAGAGGALPGLDTAELNLFNAALARFRAVDSVSGTINDAPAGTINGNGLGPRFNLNSCAGCHAQPAIGGSSAPSNPEFQVIAQGIALGSTNTLPVFLAAHGPTVEARFPFFTNSNGSPNKNAPNGGVEE